MPSKAAAVAAEHKIMNLKYDGEDMRLGYVVSEHEFRRQRDVPTSKG